MAELKEMRLEVRPADKARASCVLFHGLTGSLSDISGLASALHSRGMNVLVPRLEGHAGDLAGIARIPASSWLAQARECAGFQSSAGIPLFVAGLSFGALFALYLAGLYPDRVRGAALLSLPVRFRSAARETLLGLLSFLPDQALDRLGIVSKETRPEGALELSRHGPDAHSVGAAARLIQIRKTALVNARRISCPLLLLQDPFDHHLSVSGPARLVRSAPGLDTRLIWIPCGQHELTLGHRRERSVSLVAEFFDAILERKAGAAHAA